MNKIIHGDSLEVMKGMEANSVDTIITDPPYGLSFMGKKWDYDVPSIELWQEALRVLKPGGTALIFAGSRTQHRMAINVEDAGFILKDTIMWLYGSGFPKATDISKQLDKEQGVKPIDLGVSPNWRESKRDREKDGKMEVRGENAGRLTAPATPEAKLWNGWKSHGLKPAYEPILLAMKPNDGTYANNALKYGVSGLNIDGGRIDGEKLTPQKSGATSKAFNLNEQQREAGTGKLGDNTLLEEPKGRFPANILFDEEAAKMLDEQSGVSKSGKVKSSKEAYEGDSNSNFLRGVSNANNQHGDKGGASRFFYVAKASKAERNVGLEHFEEKKVSDGRKKEADNAYQRGKTLRANTHPTVKPLKLMEYLCILTKTPTGGIVLDMFAGSGTTGLACKNTGRDYILIEREEEYIEIIKARLSENTLF